MVRKVLACTLALLLLSGSPWLRAAPEKNGFDLTGALVPVDEIHPGGPPRDGIPSIDQPRFVSAREADFLKPRDRVLGVVRGGVAKAYPVAILNWHEIVNDHFGSEPVAVTYCPLCGTGMAFTARIQGQSATFGVSGLLYNSDVLLYDRGTESLWSQINRRAISGRHRGQRLESIPLEDTTWGDWRQRHPQTRVLSRDTGFLRSYQRNPYAGYEQHGELYFPVRFRARGYHPKERVLGVEIEGRHKAYPFSELSKTDGVVTDALNGQSITVRFDGEHQRATVEDANGKLLPGVTGFWFAWYAFHPETEVFRAAR